MKAGIGMIVCSFLGSSVVLGDTLYPRLCDALEKLVEANDYVELLLTPLWAPFFNVCLKAALEIKSRHPCQVMLTLVVKRDGCQDDCISPGADGLPLCMVDRVRVAGVPEMKGDSAHVSEKYNLLRRTISLSDHVICCLYEGLLDRENELLAYAKKLPNLKFIDVSDQEVTDAIAQCAPSMLKEREQFVLEKLDAGITYWEIGTMMGVTSARARQLVDKGGSRIRKYAYQTFVKERIMGERHERPVCAICSLGDPTDDKVEMLKAVVTTLVQRYRVNVCELSAKCCDTAYLEALTNLKWPHYVSVTAVVTEELCFECGINENDTLRRVRRYIRRVKNLDTTLTPPGTADFKMMAAMAAEADFCICDLSASPIAEEIRGYFARMKSASLLDIGKNAPCGIQAQVEMAASQAAPM